MKDIIEIAIQTAQTQGGKPIDYIRKDKWHLYASRYPELWEEYIID